MEEREKENKKKVVTKEEGLFLRGCNVLNLW